MPYRCQICKDCSDTEGFYQSDRDYPSDGSDSESRYEYRGGRWRVRSSHSRPRYHHYRRSERGGHGYRSEREGHIQSTWRQGGQNGGRTYSRRNNWRSGTINEDNNNNVRSKARGENYGRDSAGERYNSASDDNVYGKSEFIREGKRDEQRDQDGSSSDNDNDIKYENSNERDRNYNSGSDSGDKKSGLLSFLQLLKNSTNKKSDSTVKIIDTGNSKSASGCEISVKESNQKEDSTEEHVVTSPDNALKSNEVDTEDKKSQDDSVKESNQKEDNKEEHAISTDNALKTKEVDAEDEKSQDSDVCRLKANKKKEEEGKIEDIKQEEDSESSCTSDSDSFWDCSSGSESETDTDSDSEENANEEKEDAQNSRREKRAVNYKRRHQGGKYEGHKSDSHARSKSGNEKSRRKRSLHVSYVRMPTGKKYAISTPKPDDFKCGTTTKRIELNPKGRLSGYEYRVVEREMKNTIVYHQDCKRAGGCYKTFEIVKIEKLINGCLWKRYRHIQGDIIDEHHYANQRMLFHGSAKVDDIADTGFDERYSNFNGMFGAGLYFTKHSSKANQYAFGYMGGNGCPDHSNKDCHTCERKLLLCRVTLGRSKNVKTASVQAHSPPGYNSVVGVPSKKKGGLRYHEAIVYKGEQVYPEYVITYKIKN